MREDVEKHVTRCVPCAEVNDPSNLPKALLINIKARHLLRRVAVDSIGPTPRSASGYEWLLVVSDHFAKFAPAFPVRNTSPVTLVKKIMDVYIWRFGCFDGLHSDQETNLPINALGYVYCHKLGTYHFRKLIIGNKNIVSTVIIVCKQYVSI